jgi:hypothetical protein
MHCKILFTLSLQNQRLGYVLASPMSMAVVPLKTGNLQSVFCKISSNCHQKTLFFPKNEAKQKKEKSEHTK